MVKPAWEFRSRLQSLRTAPRPLSHRRRPSHKSETSPRLDRRRAKPPSAHSVRFRGDRGGSRKYRRMRIGLVGLRRYRSRAPRLGRTLHRRMVVRRSRIRLASLRRMRLRVERSCRRRRHRPRFCPRRNRLRRASQHPSRKRLSFGTQAFFRNTSFVFQHTWTWPNLIWVIPMIAWWRLVRLVRPHPKPDKLGCPVTEQTRN